MKSNLAIVAITIATLAAGAESVRGQQPLTGEPTSSGPVYRRLASGPPAPGAASATATVTQQAPIEDGTSPSVMASPQAASITPAPVAGGAMMLDSNAGSSMDCAGGPGCDACDACGDCGMPDCACACNAGFFRGWFGGGCGLSGTGCGPLEGSCLSRLFRHGPLFEYPRPVRVWGGVEGLWWWNKERNLPILATTSVAGTPFAQAGVLGEPGTSVLFGGGEFDGEASEGVRATLGLWLDCGQNCGLFTRAFRFGAEDIDFRAESAGSPILARPFLDIGTGLQDSLVVAYPGIARGSIDIGTSNEVQGYDILMRKLLYYGDCNRLDLICGYQYNEINDSTRISHEIVSTDPEGRVPFGTRLNTTDFFDAENDFYGGSIGLMAQGFDGRLTWNLLTKVAFGNNRELVSIRGNSTTTIPGDGSASFNEGLLALGTNIGDYEREQFTFVPELDLSVMYNLCSMLSVSVGYNVIYWSDVVLSGEAIDTTINPTQIGGPLIGPAAPTYSLVDDDFWLHGLTFGVHGRF